MVDNSAFTVFASAANTVTQTSAELKNRGHIGVYVFLNVTAGTSLSLVMSIEVEDPVSGAWVTLLSTATVTGVGTSTLLLCPGVTAAANAAAAAPLPLLWRVKVAAGNATSATYSVGAQTVH